MVWTDALRWRNALRNFSMRFSTAVRLGLGISQTYLTTEPERTTPSSLCLCDSVVENHLPISPSLSGGASGTRSSTDRVPDACKPESSKCPHGPGWSEPCADPRHF